MTVDPITITAKEARRLAISSQLLNKVPQQPDEEAMMAVFRRLGCVQIDPINVVARSPLLVLWSRLGDGAPELLDRLMWQERRLFEYWAHAASIVLVEDFPIHHLQMVDFTRGESGWARRVRDWLDTNESFRQYIFSQLEQRGPLFASEIEDRAVVPWESTGWTNTRNVSTMLGLLWEQGDITVTRREGDGFGLKKQWGLIEHHMPQWKDHEAISGESAVRQAALRSLKALGVATEKHINNHFIRGRYPGLTDVLEEMLADGRIRRVQIEANSHSWPGDWFIHGDSLTELAAVRDSAWPSRMVLLSPFDNLIADRERTEALFDFYYRTEIYTPRAKRQYGYYVLPVLYGDHLIGRIDPKMDRKTKTLHVHAVYKEPGAPRSHAVAAELNDLIVQLGRFLGAERVQYGGQVPASWASSFQDGRC
ncbi:MAG: winged helix-turn-helix domain-containing protein [Candidatus Promineifilaceae bacterium]